ncbi:MAG TPA: hypothetical protein VG245_07860 [Candidatus Dormibacteraeota bacterium]|jgi:hypothetical protein|nr:hypothetical protein [Candidatus Dormibacteraeota bacterium]
MYARGWGGSRARQVSTRLALIASLVASLAACSGPAVPTAGATPSPSAAVAAPPPADYNARAGSNRAAAEASMALARYLYRDGTSYWEVFVKTTPLSPPKPADPADPTQIAAQAAQVTAVEMIMATESGTAIQAFRAGGHDHEKLVVTGEAGVLEAAFPRATTIRIQVYYGERDQHAVATFTGGVLDYKVMDSL